MKLSLAIPMRLVYFLLLVFFIAFGRVIGQNETKKVDKKENKEEKKLEKKEAKRQSFGELAEESGKRIWNNLKGFLNVVAEDVIEKKDKFKKTDKPKEGKPKEKEKTGKEKESENSPKKKEESKPE